MPHNRNLMVGLSVLFLGILAGCAANWDLTQPNIIDSGDPRCSVVGDKMKIFEAETSGGQAVSCAVTITYRGGKSHASACDANLYVTKGDGKPGPSDNPAKGGEAAKTFNILDARLVEFSCKGTGEDTNDNCHYEISSVSCTKPGDKVTVIPVGQVDRNTVGCTQNKAGIWTRPAKKQSCNVTVKWSGTDHCSAAVTAHYTGNMSPSEVGPRLAMLKTFVDVRSLDFKCDGNASGENCAYSILATECK